MAALSFRKQYFRFFCGLKSQLFHANWLFFQTISLRLCLSGCVLNARKMENLE